MTQWLKEFTGRANMACVQRNRRKGSDEWTLLIIVNGRRQLNSQLKKVDFFRISCFLRSALPIDLEFCNIYLVAFGLSEMRDLMCRSLPHHQGLLLLNSFCSSALLLGLSPAGIFLLVPFRHQDMRNTLVASGR